MSRFTKEGAWSKSFEIYESLHALGIEADTTITNAAMYADHSSQEETMYEMLCLTAQKTPSITAARTTPNNTGIHSNHLPQAIDLLGTLLLQYEYNH